MDSASYKLKDKYYKYMYKFGDFETKSNESITNSKPWFVKIRIMT